MKNWTEKRQWAEVWRLGNETHFQKKNWWLLHVWLKCFSYLISASWNSHKNWDVSHWKRVACQGLPPEQLTVFFSLLLRCMQKSSTFNWVGKASLNYFYFQSNDVDEDDGKIGQWPPISKHDIKVVWYFGRETCLEQYRNRKRALSKSKLLFVCVYIHRD